MEMFLELEKKEHGRQRKVWNGSGISKITAKPPKSERLANPSSFLDIEAAGSELFFSKRDAATYFDVLQVPEDIQPWLAQPPICVETFLHHGSWTSKELEGFVVSPEGKQLAASDIVYPCHTVWPMGYSWSSAVPQACTLSCVAGSGIDEAQILSPDHPVPSDQCELCMVATDDTVFIHTDSVMASEALRNFDDAFERVGIPRNVGKDVSAANCITAIGCDLCTLPNLVEPAIGKLGMMAGTFLDLVVHPRASPKALNIILGTEQWFMLL